tara:strand:- start:456 stop:650 length:195 start_codon:yes stop_codon:yes gene_type:complete
VALAAPPLAVATGKDATDSGTVPRLVDGDVAFAVTEKSGVSGRPLSVKSLVWFYAVLYAGNSID